MIRWLTAVATLFFASLFFAPAAQAQQQGEVTCQSWQYQPARCDVPGLSRADVIEVLGGDCRQGRSWGYDRQGIWVNNGCRARFSFDARGGYPGGGYPGGGGGAGNIGQQIRCESINFRPARCPIDVRGGVDIVRVLGGNCIQGRNWTWGYDRGGIDVRQGCRAIFIVTRHAGLYDAERWDDQGRPVSIGGAGYPGTGVPNSLPITCESKEYAPAVCQTGPIRRAEINEVLGGNCVQGETWGYSRSSIWVNQGCRARFRVFG